MSMRAKTSVRTAGTITGRTHRCRRFSRRCVQHSEASPMEVIENILQMCSTHVGPMCAQRRLVVSAGTDQGLLPILYFCESIGVVVTLLRESGCLAFKRWTWSQTRVHTAHSNCADDGSARPSLDVRLSLQPARVVLQMHGERRGNMRLLIDDRNMCYSACF